MAMSSSSGTDFGAGAGNGLSSYDASSDDELKNQQLNSWYNPSTWDASNPMAGINTLNGMQFNDGYNGFYNGQAISANNLGEDANGNSNGYQTPYTTSSNGTRLDLTSTGDGKYTFRDSYNDPNGKSDRDQRDVNYSFDPRTGTATPTSTNSRYQAGDWVDKGQSLATWAAIMATAGIGGAALGGGEAAGAGAGAGAAGGSAATGNMALIDSGLGTAGYGGSSAGTIGYGAGSAGGGTLGFGNAGGASGGAGASSSPAAQVGTELGAAESGAGGTGYVKSSSDLAALYGNTGYGSTGPGFWSSVASGAGKGALTNGGITAARGGNGDAILKGAAYGAVGGAIGGGIGNYNPAGEMGVTNPYAANAVNSGITGGVNAGLAGGNVGQGIVGGGINSGVNSAYNYAGDAIGNYFKPNAGGGMPDYGMPDTGTIGGNMYDENGESSATLGGDFTQAQQQANLGTNGYVPMQGGEAPQAPGMRAQSAGSTGGLGGFISGLTSNGGLGQMATGLNAAYMAYNARKRANGALDTINGLYAPDSPYAQQMQQSLARKDAAGGRNSQYGTRAVELAAALTNARSNALTSPGYQNMLMQQQKASQQLPITLASMAQSKWGQGAMTSAGDYLQRLYQNYNQPQPTAQTYSDWGPGE